MSPTQRIRLKNVRASDLYDDSKTPSEIANAESTAEDQQEFQNLLLSQINRIVGGMDWKASVPVTLTDVESQYVSEETHKALRQLIHFIDSGPAEGAVSGAYETTNWDGVFDTSQIWWTHDDKKILEKTLTWSGVVCSQIVWKLYHPDGVTVLVTVTDDYTYVNLVFESRRTRTITI